MEEQWLKYAWLDDERNDDLMAGCLGVVLGGDEATVLRQLAVVEGSLRKATVHEAWQMSESDFGNDVVQVAVVGDAVVTFEPNGWHGVEPGTAVALSEHGRYAAYFWNVNAVMQFVFAERGSIHRSFDPLLYDTDGEREQALPEEVGLPFPLSTRMTPAQASLALLERLTGVAITRPWLLEEARPTYLVSPEAGSRGSI